MNWFARLLGLGRSVEADVAAAVEAYRGKRAPPSDRDIRALRYVVVDVETSGLDPFRDRLISIGAVAVESGRVELSGAFEAVLRQDRPSHARNILVHGIDGTTQISGEAPARAIARFLDFAGMAPLVGFHADFDRIMIGRAARRAAGIGLRQAWLDLALIAPALLGGELRANTLDEWTSRFGIRNYARHNAVADAYATAQLFLVVLEEAARRGLRGWGDLVTAQRRQRWLDRAAGRT